MKMTHKISPKIMKIECQKSKLDYTEVVNDLFNKHFPVIKEDNHRLPDADTMFTSSPWQIDKLQALKKELNHVKSKLNDFSFDIWHEHTSDRNKAGIVQWSIKKEFNPEFLTQAWCKFYEILSSFEVVPGSANGLVSVHLCEAPGAFVASLNHWLKLNRPTIAWDWIAMTLNPYYEGHSLRRAVNDDRFIIQTLKNWYFGSDDTGNIMSLDNIDDLVEKLQNKENVLLVTADGSIDCSFNPGEQESDVFPINFCEVFTALSVLDLGGTLVLKMFTIFEHRTICLVYLLNLVFGEIHAKKPVTSKEGNSEIYLVCLKFKGRAFALPYINKLRSHLENELQNAMFSLEEIPESFIKQIIDCSQFFKEYQSSAIIDNINTFASRGSCNDLAIKKIRGLVLLKYVEKCKLKKLQDEDKIVTNISSNTKCLNFSNKKLHTESYNEICKKKCLNSIDRLVNVVKAMKNVNLVTTVYNFEFSNDLFELSIQKGKPFDNVINSKFCYGNILRELLEFREIVDNLELRIRFPSNEDINLYLIEQKISPCNMVQFHYISDQNNGDILNALYKAFNELNEGECLTLFGYCLLSRFNLGLLFILGHAFDSMELNLTERLGCIIILRGKKIVQSVMQKLKQICSALEEAQKQNFTILSVIPICMLCDTNFYTAIVESNACNFKCYTRSNDVLKATNYITENEIPQ